MSNHRSDNPHKKNLVFILGCCQYPPDLIRQRQAYKTLSRISSYIKENNFNRIDDEIVALITGDSIYADATAGLFDPVEEISKYTNSYITFNNAPQKQALDALSVNFLYTIDDHEINENWEPVAPEELLLQGKRNFLLGHRRGAGLNPPRGISEDEYLKNNLRDIPLWRRVSRQGTELFLMDTRTEREQRTLTNHTSANLISKKQKKALFEWLDEMHRKDIENQGPFAQPKFIVSGSMPLPRQQFISQSPDDTSVCLNSDGWDGYPATLNQVLSHIAKNGIKNVIFLSGDAHIPCFAKATLNFNGASESTTIFSIHAAPFHAPFPFGNAVKEDFAEKDIFRIKTTASLSVDATVHCEFPNIGNGFISFEIPKKDDNQLYFNIAGDKGASSYEVLLN